MDKFHLKGKFSLKLGGFSPLKFLKGSHRLESIEQPSSPEESFAELDTTNIDTTSESNLDTAFDSLRWSSPGSDESFTFALPSIQFIDPSSSPDQFGCSPAASSSLDPPGGFTKEEAPHNQLLQLSHRQDLTGHADDEAAGWQPGATGGSDSSVRLYSRDRLDSTDLSTESERRLSTMEQSIESQLAAKRLIDLSGELKEHLTAKLTLYSILFGFDEIDDRIRKNLLEESSVLLDDVMNTRLVRAADNGQSSTGLFDYAFKEKLVLNLVKNYQFLNNFEMLTCDDKMSLVIENHLLLALLNELPANQSAAQGEH